MGCSKYITHEIVILNQYSATDMLIADLAGFIIHFFHLQRRSETERLIYKMFGSNESTHEVGFLMNQTKLITYQSKVSADRLRLALNTRFQNTHTTLVLSKSI